MCKNLRVYVSSCELPSVCIFLLYIFFWTYIYSCISLCIYKLLYTLPLHMHITSVFIIFVCLPSLSICSFVYFFYSIFFCVFPYMLSPYVCYPQVYVFLYVPSILFFFVWLFFAFHISSMYMSLCIYLTSFTWSFNLYITPYIYIFYVHIFPYVCFFVLLFFHIKLT